METNRGLTYTTSRTILIRNSEVLKFLTGHRWAFFILAIDSGFGKTIIEI